MLIKFIAESAKRRLPFPVVFCAVGMTLGSATFFEKKALYKIDHPKPHNVSCIKCHEDQKTFKAIADKSGDNLYLVHQGQLTVDQLKQVMCTNPAKNSTTWKGASYK